MSKYGVFSGPYFPAFGLNTERYEVPLRIQFECGKIRTRKNSVSGHISHSDGPDEQDFSKVISQKKHFAGQKLVSVMLIKKIYGNF